MDESRIKHLEFLQHVIARMSQHSFAIKSIAISLTGAVVGLATLNKSGALIFVGIYPSAFFWLLDAHYLWCERRFRSLYDNVRNSVGPSDMDMKPPSLSWRSAFITYCEVVLSSTEILLYLPLIAILLLIGRLT